MKFVNSRQSLFSLTDLLLLTMVSIWAINFSVIKNVISGDLPPIAFTALRFALATLVLLPLLRDRADYRSQPGDRWKIAGVGLIGNTLYQILFINGINNTSPTSAALINAMPPIFIAVIGVLTRVERLNRLAWFGVFIAFAGIGIIILGNAPNESAPGKNSLLGDVLVLGAAMMWATYTVLTAPLLRRYSPIRLTTLTVSAGTLPLLLVAAPTFLTMNWSAVGLNSWLGVLFSGGLAIALGYVLWNRGVQQVGGARTAVYSNLTPVLTAVFAFVVRGDPLTIYHAIGAVVILTGITLTRRGRRHL